ncbi:MAG: SLAC1 anion channel family protein [Pseudomonadota bacterium]
MNTPTAASHHRLQHFPVAFFSSVMGLAGLAMALQQGESILGLPRGGGHAVTVASLVVFALLAIIYILKTIRFPEAVAQEWRHPVKMSFGATITVSLLLLGGATLGFWPKLSYALWLAGAALHLLVTLYVLNAWIHKPGFEITHINPAWFIPVVGNIVAPIAGVVHAGPETGWFFFSIGLVFWLVLFTIIVYRMIFHQPMPERLLPTFFILLAPPAAGFIAYLKLSGALDSFGRVLFHTAAFIAMLLLLQVPRLWRLKFFLSWWAYSFPLAALTIATQLMFHATNVGFFRTASYLLLILLCGVIALLLALTARAIARNEICTPEQ